LHTNLQGDALILHKKSRNFYFNYVTQQAKKSGILPFFWDTGDDGALFNRKNNTVKNQQALDAIIKGVTE
jgi:endoglucanase